MPGMYGTPSPFTLSFNSLKEEQAVIGLNTRNSITRIFLIINYL